MLGISLFGCSSSSNANVEIETISNVESEKDTNESSKEVGMQDKTRAIKVNDEDRHYIFDLNDEVNREHVYFDNRFGIEMAADLYTSKNINKNELHTAIVIGPPFGGVKEQGPGVYANELAKRGFVVLAFANATEPKEFYEVKDANHVDLYYDTNKIPFDKIESFINQSVDKQ